MKKRKNVRQLMRRKTDEEQKGGVECIREEGSRKEDV